MDKILVVEDDKTVYSGIKKASRIAAFIVWIIAQNGIGGFGKNR